MPQHNRWLALFVVTRLIATAAGAALLVAHALTDNYVVFAVIATVYGGGTTVLAIRQPELQRNPLAWTVDATALLLLIFATATWRSPFYLLALTALIFPATGLPLRRALAFGVAFAAGYFVAALLTGIDSDTLQEDTYRLESFTTHLLVPLMIVIALAFARRLIFELQDERMRSEQLAVEAERRRIAWELHDSAKQRVHAAHLMLSQHQRREVAEPDPMLDQALTELQAATTDIETSLTELHTRLGGGGLLGAVRKRAAELERLSGVTIEVRGDVPELSTTAAAHTFRVLGEAMTNAVRHAGASHIRVRLASGDGRFTAEVADDGHGLPSELRPGSNGIRSMRRRAGMLGGSLTLVSGSASGPAEGNGSTAGEDGPEWVSGTTVRFEIPLHEPGTTPPIADRASEPDSTQRRHAEAPA